MKQIIKKLLFSAIHGRSSAGEDDDDEQPKPMEISSPVFTMQKPFWRCFSYAELHFATNGFHQENLVGKGGSSEVYRGVLAGGQAVAVKRLTRAMASGRKEQEFLTELGTVGHARHPNVCALVGCCVDDGLFLVLEFSPRGSVSANLHGGAPLPWKARVGVVLGTARGLHYLHKGCKRRIIHRDIKASNVLLTEKLEPQISDFGLARWLPSEWAHRAVAPIEGSFGCLAPEYFTHGIIDEKTDVFAFGVFLLEVITGRKPVDGSHKSLLSWARPLLKDGTVEALVDPRIARDYNADELGTVAFVASLCIRTSAVRRPSMTEVLDMLEGREALRDRQQAAESDTDEEDEAFWGFDDLDDEDDECDTPSSSSLTNLST